MSCVINVSAAWMLSPEERGRAGRTLGLADAAGCVPVATDGSERVHLLHGGSVLCRNLSGEPVWLDASLRTLGANPLCGSCAQNARYECRFAEAADE